MTLSHLLWWNPFLTSHFPSEPPGEQAPGMFAILFNWVLRPIATVILGQASLQACHLYGYFPDRYLAEFFVGLVAGMTVDANPEFLTAIQWILAALIGVALFSVYEYFNHWRRKGALTIGDGDKGSALVASPEFHVQVRVDGGYAEVCVRNLSDTSTLKDIMVTVPNYSIDTQDYDPINIQFRLKSIDGSIYINPRGQKYFRFSQIIRDDGTDTIELYQ